MEKHEIAIQKFIGEMGYKENEHVLGAFFYGSYLTGLYHDKSDIDMHIIFDASNPYHLIRGNKWVNGFRVEYFEKPIEDLYLSVNNDFEKRNVAWKAIIGTSKILFDKNDQLKLLQEYTFNKYSNPLPKLSLNEALAEVYILSNRIQKLKMYVYSPQFVHLYHLTIEKIMKFYHDFCGLARISTTKVYKMYTDEKTKKSYKIPENEFIDRYLNTMCDCYSPHEVKLEKIKALYEYARRDISLGEDYRIPIKSRNLSR